jgi:hypothetical protein
MNLRLLPVLVATLLPLVPLAGQTSAPKSADKAAKAPAKSAADLSFEAFNRERGAGGARDQARFQKVIAAGMDYLAKHPTQSRANEVILGLAFYAGGIPKEQAALCAGGFRDTTRIASGSPEMWRDIALANRENLARVLGVLIEDLQEFQRSLQQGDSKAVTEFFTSAKERRDAWANPSATATAE